MPANVDEEPLTPLEQRRFDALVQRGVNARNARDYARNTSDATFWGKVRHADDLMRLRPNLKNKGGFVLSILNDVEERYGPPPRNVPPPPLTEAAQEAPVDPVAALRFLLTPHLPAGERDVLIAALPDPHETLKVALVAVREGRLSVLARDLQAQ